MNFQPFQFQAQLEQEAMADARFRDQMEQERRDHELALRLAQETNGQLEDVSPPLRRYFFFTLMLKSVLVPITTSLK